VDCIHLVRDREQKWALVETVVNLGGSIKDMVTAKDDIYFSV
jgi:hypothetical protein